MSLCRELGASWLARSWLPLCTVLGATMAFVPWQAVDVAMDVFAASIESGLGAGGNASEGQKTGPN